MDNKPVKDKVKAKAKTIKDKIKAKAKAIKDKVKGAVKVLAAAFLCAALAGCMDTAPASRYTASTVGDITVKNNVDDFRNKPGHWATNAAPPVASAPSPLVSITTTISLSDMTIASADSAGSTETQKATPTMDIKPDVDVHYNDPVGTGGNAVAAFTSSLTSEGMAVLKDYIANKKSGKVTVTKTDGTTETLTCENGKCTTSGGLVIDSSNCPNCEEKQ